MFNFLIHYIKYWQTKTIRDETKNVDYASGKYFTKKQTKTMFGFDQCLKLL